MTPTCWNDAVVKWREYASRKIEETFTEDVINLGNNLHKIKELDRDEINIQFACDLQSKEDAIMNYLAYVDQFNLNRHAKGIFDFVKNKNMFNEVVMGLNFILAGELPQFRSDYGNKKAGKLIDDDMKAILKVDEILIRLGLGDIETEIEIQKNDNRARIAREVLRDIYSDLGQGKSITEARRYKPEVLCKLDTLMINSLNMTQYFQQDDNAYIGSIIRRMLKAFEISFINVNKTLASAVIRNIVEESLNKKKC